MKNESKTIIVFILFFSTLLAREFEGSRKNSILLNGVWEYVQGNGMEEETILSNRGDYKWQKVNIPGPFMPYNNEAATNIKYIWTRRSFTITAEQAKSLAVLRWNRIANGAEAFINGKKIGENEPTGPYQVIIPARVLKPGENLIVIKVRGARGVKRSKSGNPLIPAGFGVGMPEITDDIWIDFARDVYIKWALAIPDIAGGRVKIRVTPAGIKEMSDYTIVAFIKSHPDGRTVGEGKTHGRLVPAANPLACEHFYVDVPLTHFKLWTHESPYLYTAIIRLEHNGVLLDELSFRFGMREITVKDGNYKLNGKNIWFRGSNLVFEWNWGDIVKGKEVDYLVGEAREMSMN
ncbi:MAG: hypothetical protein N2487_05400, partial [Verrucomicrobiae bacterium]|nr:hypothetical protein [Verrucomicrobiae bacterium]